MPVHGIFVERHWNRTCILHISLIITIIIIICTGFLNVLLFWENNMTLIIQFCEMFVFCEQNDYHRVLGAIFYIYSITNEAASCYKFVRSINYGSCVS